MPPTPAELRPGAHGDDARRVARALGIDPSTLLDLATTLNPVAPDVVAAVRRAADGIRWYPDDARATAALAEHLGVAPARVVLTNGGSEAIALVAAEHPSGFVRGPEFALYARHLRSTDDEAHPWASNPNNPTGRLAGDDERAFVWDEAHHVIATGRWTRGDADAIAVGSLTKAFACPGLRVGYVVARDGDEATRLRDRQPRWAIGSIAADVVPELLEHTDVAKWPAAIAARRAELVAVLEAHGLTALPSDAPWVLVPDSAGLRERLLRHHVLVRDAASFGLAGCTRLAVPDAAGLERLAIALERAGNA